MTAVAAPYAESRGAARRRSGSLSRDRQWALRWSYFFLVLFVIFFLLPPVYMLITSLKTSAEISAAGNLRPPVLPFCSMVVCPPPEPRDAALLP